MSTNKNLKTEEYLKKQKETTDFINDNYDFKNIFQKTCSKYDIKEHPHVLPSVRRIIVIGDIHGDWEMTIKSLKLAELINNNGDWIGGDTVVVQVGDQVDRCRYSGVPCNEEKATDPDEGNDWKILKYFTNLHKKAQKQGGAVYSLIGNHELMNVRGDFRYVSYEGLREFDNYEKPDGTIIRDGNEARRWAFEPGNSISEFMACTRQMALIIGSNLFVHAGVLPNIAKKYSVQNLNQLMSLYLFDQLKKPSQYKDIFDSSDYSPLWNRVFGRLGLEKLKKHNGKYASLIKTLKEIYGREKLKKCFTLLNPLKDIYQVDKIFVGHTPLMDNGIGSVCDNRIWLTDYGASKAFDKFDKKIVSDERGQNRKAQVLEILEDGKTINILK